jgi:hypothetical protein
MSLINQSAILQKRIEIASLEIHGREVQQQMKIYLLTA